MRSQARYEKASDPSAGVRGLPPERERTEALDKRISIGHVRAMLSAVGIFLYFAVATVWLPSALLRSPLLTGASRNISDVLAVVVWALGFGLGVWGLRHAQDRGWI